MDTENIEEKEVYEVNNQKYTVITRQSKDSLSKEQLKKLICNYAMKELQEDY